MPARQKKRNGNKAQTADRITLPAALTRHRILLIAGAGALPIEVAATLRRSKVVHQVLGIAGLTNRSDFTPSPFQYFNIGKLRPIRKLVTANLLDHVCFAGSLTRPNLRTLRLDFDGARFTSKLLLNYSGFFSDDNLLTRIIELTEATYQLKSISAAAIVKQWVPTSVGALTRAAPSDNQLADITRARQILAGLSAFDIGQALVINCQQVICIEGRTGTDAMLQQASSLPTDHQGGILVKAAKLGQNLNIDLPTIGPQTIENTAKARLSGIAITANQSFILDLEQVVAAAEQHKIFIAIMPPLTSADALGAAKQIEQHGHNHANRSIE